MTKQKSSFKQAQQKRNITLAIIGVCFAVLILYIIFGTSDPETKKLNELQSKINSSHSANLNFIQSTRRQYGLKKGKKLSKEEHARLMNAYEMRAKANRERRLDLLKELNRLKPETRKKLIRALMKSRLAEAREQTAHLTDKEKKEVVDKMVGRVRNRNKSLSAADRKQRKDRMNSPEAQERVKEQMDFYMNEMSAKERELLDPLVREVLSSINEQ